MGERNFYLHDGHKGAAVAVRVIPGAHRNALADITKDGTLKIQLTDQIDEPDLNSSLTALLSLILEVPVQTIDVIAGENGLDKLVSILGIEPALLQERLIKGRS